MSLTRRQHLRNSYFYIKRKLTIYRQPRPIPVIDPAIGTSSVKRGLLISKLYYFFFFGAIGCFVPFFNVYLKQIGLTGAQIGWVGSIPPLIALAANPFWGAISDRWQIYRQVLALLDFVSGAVSLFFIPASSFWVLMALVTVMAFFRTPIGAIVDSTVMDMVKKTGHSYGRQRMWGTVGFILATFTLGQLLTLDDLSLTFILHATLLGVGCTVLSFFLPVAGTDKKVALWDGLRKLVRQVPYLSFLISMTLLGMGLASHLGFLGLQMLSLGGTEQQVGLAWAVNSVMEIPMMYFGASWFIRFSLRRLIVAGFGGISLVWLLVGLSTSPTKVIIMVSGLGLCFGFFWVAAVGFASSSAPPGLSATAQALMGAALTGLGWSIGSVIAGYLWDFAGGEAVYFFAASAALLAVLVFVVGNRRV